MKCKIALVRDGSAEPGSRSIDEDAARWSEILRERDDPTMREAFNAWQAQSPQHAQAYARADAARRLAEMLADESQMQALRRDTLGRVAREGAQRRRRQRGGWAVAASVAVFGLLGAIGLNLGGSWKVVDDARDALAGNVYQTGVGQRESFVLADGSTITLNTDSRVSTHYRDGLRAVTLERGQALFKVAKDRTRPFVVSAGGRQVTALGTEFDVYLSSRAFEVTLLEGRVTVTRAAKAAAAAASAKAAAGAAALAELRPGEQFVAAAKTAPQVRAADVRRVVSWRNGQIVFENERLSDAVAEINRYSQRKIVLADAHLASLKISGAFNTGDTGTFVEALTDYFPIERDTLANDDIVLKPRAPDAPLRG